MAARICRLSGAAPLRVAIINHGSVPYGADPAMLQPQACEAEATRWFLDRGFLVLLPVRHGYGATGGELRETSGSCENPDYLGAGLAGAQDIDAAVRYATALPDARPDDAVVVGQSIGGWAVVAYDSVPHPSVGAFIAMAPGRGGWAGGVPGQNCRPDLLAQAAARYAANSSTPMLWVYAANDSFFPPAVVAQVAGAYRSTGGRLSLAQVGPFDGEGHALFQGAGGSAVWGPYVADYLRRLRPSS